MTDASTPGGTAPGPEDAEREEPEVDLNPERSGEDVPGAPGSDAPMTDSIDGGLEGGEPGVEE